MIDKRQPSVHLLPVNHQVAPLQKNMRMFAVMAAHPTVNSPSNAALSAAVHGWAQPELTYSDSSELTRKSLLFSAVQRLWGRGMQVWLVRFKRR